MTPERKKYLAGIGRKEAVIRTYIDNVKQQLKDCKKWLKADNGSYAPRLEMIKYNILITKQILMMLKKQLPQRWPKEKLKPCPFCGAYGNDVRLHVKYDKKIDEEIARVKCFKCALEIGWFHGKDNALKAWNKRSSDE